MRVCQRITGSLQEVVGSTKRANAYRDAQHRRRRPGGGARAPAPRAAASSSSSSRSSSAGDDDNMAVDMDAPGGMPDHAADIQMMESIVGVGQANAYSGMNAVDANDLLAEIAGVAPPDDDELAARDEAPADEAAAAEALQADLDADVEQLVVKEEGLRVKVPPKTRFAYMVDAFANAAANAEAINKAIELVPPSSQRRRRGDGSDPAACAASAAPRKSLRVVPVQDDDLVVARSLLSIMVPVKKLIKMTEGFVSAGEAVVRMRETVAKLHAMNLSGNLAEARRNICSYFEGSEWGTTARRARSGVPSTRDMATDEILLRGV